MAPRCLRSFGYEKAKASTTTYRHHTHTSLKDSNTKIEATLDTMEKASKRMMDTMEKSIAQNLEAKAWEAYECAEQIKYDVGQLKAHVGQHKTDATQLKAHIG